MTEIEPAAQAEKPKRQTIAQRTRRQVGEWNQWEAVDEIRMTNGALAYAAGHPVPAGNVVDGRIVLARHMCDGDPSCGGSANARCEQFNEPTELSEEGLITQVGG